MMEIHNSLTDLHSLLATVAQTAVDRDKLQQAIYSLQASEVCETNFSVVTNSVHHIAQHNFSFSFFKKTFHTFHNGHGYSNTNFNNNMDFSFTIKCLKKYFSKLLAYSGDIFTVWFSSFLSINKCFSIFHQSTNISNTDESCSQEDTLLSDYNRLQHLVTFGSRECFSQTNTM